MEGPRTVRLAALADSPDAFGSTLAAEEAFDEARWRQRTGSNVVAFVGDEAVGLAGSYVDPAIPDTLELVALWVSPGHRPRGVAPVLVVSRRSGAGATSFDVKSEIAGDDELTSPMLPGFALPVGSTFER